jgi:hypothetical protein
MRYFFHVQTEGDYIEDLEGVELPNFDAVQNEAVKAARVLMANQMLQGQAPDSREFRVADAAGTMVLRYRFKDAIS